jgi:lysophospholipase L1-like esterase
MSRRGDLAVGLLVSLAATLVLLVVLEGVARLALPRPDSVLVPDLQPPVPVAPGSRERRVRIAPNEALFRETERGGRMYPNVHVTVRKHQVSGRRVEIRTNALGYRGDEVGPKTAQDFRILVLGDSITLADYAPEDETYPARMEQRLREYGQATKKIRVINAGVAGLDLRSEFMVLMETGLRTKPDIVVEGLYLNDAALSFALKATVLPPYIRWSRFLTFLAGRVDSLRLRYQYRLREHDWRPARARFVAGHPLTIEDDWHDSQTAFNPEIADTFFDWGYAWSEEAWARMGETLRLMKQVASDHDFELFVVLFPVRQQVQSRLLRDAPQRSFETLMRTLGLPHLDLLPALRDKFARDGRDLYWDHCHYRPEGDEFIGRLIADTLARESPRLRSVGVSPAAR